MELGKKCRRVVYRSGTTASSSSLSPWRLTRSRHLRKSTRRSGAILSMIASRSLSPFGRAEPLFAGKGFIGRQQDVDYLRKLLLKPVNVPLDAHPIVAL